MVAVSRKRPRRYRPETLEARVLLATISGVKWNDVDGDGARDAAEPGLPGWTIYYDANDNNARDTLEPSDVTDASGAYSLTVTGRSGTFVSIREVPQAGWRASFPASGEHTIPLPSISVAGINFGNTQRGLVTGTKFNDVNDNGRFDFNERGLAGWTIFADNNGDGVLSFREPSDVTDAAGNYALNLAPGTYTLREVPEAGWWQTYPAGGAHAVTLAQGQVASGRDFGNVAIVYDLVSAGFAVTSPVVPVPGDGRVDVEYAVLNDGTGPSPGFHVAIYLSDDATITAADTLLRNIAWGSIPRHETQTRTASITLPRPDPFQSDNEYFIGMIVDSGNVVPETDETNNSNRGQLVDKFPLMSEADLPRPVDNSTVRATPIGVGGSATGAIGDEWIGGLDQDIYRLPVTAGHELQITADGLGSPVMIRLYNSAWSLLRLTTAAMDYTVPSNDTYYVVLSSGGNGLNDPRRLAGRTEGPTGPYTLTVGARNGIDIIPTIASSGGTPPDSPLMNFRINGVPYNRPFDVALYLSDDDQVTPADRLVTTVRVTQADYNFEFDYHIVRPAFVLPAVDPFVTDNEYWVGLVLDSSNEIPERNETNNFNQGDGIDRKSWRSERNIGSPADGQTVSTYSSTGFGNPLALSIGDEWIGPYDQDFTPVSANANETLNFDVDRTGGTLDSYIRLYDDVWNLVAANDNGAAPGEPAGLDSFLRHSFSVGGRYWVVVSGRGNHTNHPLLLTGRTAASTGDVTLTTTSEPAGDVTGIVFHDADADGVQDPGETGLEGRRVYIDNGDEFFSGNELSVLTGPDGTFRFTGLRPNTYTFRQVAPAGSIPTAPDSNSHTLVLTSGQPAGPIAFGTIQQVTLSGTAYNDLDGDGTRDAGEGGRGGVVAYADLNNNGVRDLTPLTLSLTGVPLDIRAGNQMRVTIEGTPSRPLVVGDVDVLLDIRDADYDAYLSHAGLNLHVLDVPDSSSLNRNAWRIDDEAATTTGLHRRPIQPLSALDGTNVGGKWWLVIDDHREGGVFSFPPPGDLYAWSLNLTLSEPFTLTDAAGAYTLAGLLPGDYHVRAEREADWIPTAPAAGVYDATLAEGGSATGLDFGARQRRLQIADHHVFYNNSAFDGRDRASDARDDAAIATDKSAGLPGGAAAFANVTSYDKGLNGVMVDVSELIAPLGLADFTFKVQSVFNPSLWLDAPAPSLAVRDLPGGDYNRRYTFTWPDHLLRNVWLQVGVVANTATRLPATELAYFGNLVGDTGAASTPNRFTVGAADLLATRGGTRAGVDNPLDHNRDGWVNIRDQVVVRQNLGRALTRLTFTPPAAAVMAIGPRRAALPPRSDWVAGLLT